MGKKGKRKLLYRTQTLGKLLQNKVMAVFLAQLNISHAEMKCFGIIYNLVWESVEYELHGEVSVHTVGHEEKKIKNENKK